MATTALTLHPPENFNLAVFNLAINGQIRQIAKLKLPPNFPVMRYSNYVTIYIPANVLTLNSFALILGITLRDYNPYNLYQLIYIRRT